MNNYYTNTDLTILLYEVLVGMRNAPVARAEEYLKSMGHTVPPIELEQYPTYERMREAYHNVLKDNKQLGADLLAYQVCGMEKRLEDKKKEIEYLKKTLKEVADGQDYNRELYKNALDTIKELETQLAENIQKVMDDQCIAEIEKHPVTGEQYDDMVRGLKS